MLSKFNRHRVEINLCVFQNYNPNSNKRLQSLFSVRDNAVYLGRVFQYTPSGSSSIGSLIDLGRDGLDCFLGTGGSFFFGLLVWSFCSFSKSRKLKLQNSMELSVYIKKGVELFRYLYLSSFFLFAITKYHFHYYVQCIFFSSFNSL